MLAHVSHWRFDITLTVYLRLPLVPAPARSCLGRRGSPGAWSGQLYTRHSTGGHWSACHTVTVTGRCSGRCSSCTDGASFRSQETPSSSQPITPKVIEASLFVGEVKRERDRIDCPGSQMIHTNLNPAWAGRKD